MTTDMKAIPERLRWARRLAGKTQEDAARELGVRVRTYARWEKGDTSGYLGELEKIAAVFGTTVDDLLDGTGVQPPDARVNAQPDADLGRQLAELTREVHELRELLLDPARLRAEAEALIQSEAPPRARRRKG